MPEDRLDHLGALERRYSGPIPRHLLNPLLLNATVTEIMIGRAHGELRHCRSALATHSQMRARDRAMYLRWGRSAAARILELEARRLTEE